LDENIGYLELKMSTNIPEKSPSESHAEVIVRMFPSDANPAGNVFGGEILKNIDMVAGIVAQRHSQSNAVTVSLDSVNFLKPVFVGNVLFLNARINYVHNSSMEIEVKAEAEDIVTGIRTVLQLLLYICCSWSKWKTNPSSSFIP